MQNETGINETGIIEKKSEVTEIKGIREAVKPGDSEPGMITVYHKEEPKVEPVYRSVKRKKLGSHLDNKATKSNRPEPEIEEVNLEISPLKGKEAPEIHLKYSFPILLIPGLRNEKQIENYMEQRVKEVKEGGINPVLIEESRLGVRDNGLPMGKLERCQAGIDLFYLLLEAKYKLIDAYRKYEPKAHGNKNGKPRHVIYLVLSQKGERMILDREVFKALKEVMKKTMTAYLWDNRHLPQNTVMVNFPYEHINQEDLSIKVPYVQKLVIKK